MNTESIRTFLSLANSKSFSKTAQELMVVQSTVSARIKDMEKKIGHKLFDRNTGSVSLTPEGQVFLVYFQKMLDLQEAAITEINMLSQYSSLLKIATPHILFDSYVCPLSIQFMDENKDVSLGIEIAHSQEILANISQYRYDMVFSYFPFNHNQYVCLPYLKDHIIMVTRAENNRYQGGVTLKEAKELTFIYTDYLSMVDLDWLTPKRRMYPMSLNIMSKAIPYLMASDCYCFLPRELLLKELETGALIEIPIVNIKMPEKESFIICKKDYERLHSLNRWIQTVTSYCDQTGQSAALGAEKI